MAVITQSNVAVAVLNQTDDDVSFFLKLAYWDNVPIFGCVDRPSSHTIFFFCVNLITVLRNILTTSYFSGRFQTASC